MVSREPQGDLGGVLRRFEDSKRDLEVHRDLGISSES